MKKAAVIGAGNVGTSAALALARMNIAEVVITDVVEGLATGKALDIAQSAQVHGFDVPVSGASDMAIIEGAEAVIVTAGRPRKPGMSRGDLLRANADIISSVAENIVSHAPDAVVVCITNPLDIMCYHMFRQTGFPSRRVMGMAGVLDSARFALFLAQEAGCSPNDVSCMVLGGHGDEMVPLVSSAAVRGVPVRDLVDEDALERAVERTRRAGAEIVGLLKTGSAFVSPGAAGAGMARAVLCDTGVTMPASAYLSGQYGYEDIYLGVPVQITSEGTGRIIEVELSPEEKAALDVSASAVKEGIEALA